MKKYFYELIDPWEVSIVEPDPWFQPLSINTSEILSKVLEMKLPKGLTYKTEKNNCNIKLISAVIEYDEVLGLEKSIETTVEITVGAYTETFYSGSDLEELDAETLNIPAEFFLNYDVSILDAQTIQDLNIVLVDSFIKTIKIGLALLSTEKLDPQFGWSLDFPIIDEVTGDVYNSEEDKVSPISSLLNGVNSEYGNSVLPEGMIVLEPLEKVNIEVSDDSFDILELASRGLFNISSKFESLAKSIANSEYLDFASTPTEDEGITTLKNKILLKYFAVDSEGDLSRHYNSFNGLKSSNTGETNG